VWLCVCVVVHPKSHTCKQTRRSCATLLIILIRLLGTIVLIRLLLEHTDSYGIIILIRLTCVGQSEKPFHWQLALFHKVFNSDTPCQVTLALTRLRPVEKEWGVDESSVWPERQKDCK
jgi:hypothetical protein